MEPIEVSMNERQCLITLTGQISTDSVNRLIREIDLGFDYYQFPEVTVLLDSPGGENTAMLTLLELFKQRRLQNRPVHVHASQLCASAAALILSNGYWGTRAVEPQTQLLYHWSRAVLPQGQFLTSEIAASLAKGLSGVDQKMLDRLFNEMCTGAGGEQALIDMISDRLDELLGSWDETARSLNPPGDHGTAKQTAWVKVLQKNIKQWNAKTSINKKKAGVESYLKAIFEKDAMMDLREAYALCLLDIVKGVLPPLKSSIVSLTKVQRRPCNDVVTDRQTPAMHQK